MMFSYKMVFAVFIVGRSLEFLNFLRPQKDDVVCLLNEKTKAQRNEHPHRRTTAVCSLACAVSCCNWL